MIAYLETERGKLFEGDFFELYKKHLKRFYKNSFQLTIISPPFPLNNKKQYGNLTGDKDISSRIEVK